jgi:hypothetical protein
MNRIKALRDQVSYKQHEDYIREIRDQLCSHYRLNKSDLVKYLIKKEEHAVTSLLTDDKHSGELE